MFLDAKASRQYPFHVQRHSEVGLVSGFIAASFGTRLLTSTVGDKWRKMGEVDHLALVRPLRSNSCAPGLRCIRVTALYAYWLSVLWSRLLAVR